MARYGGFFPPSFKSLLWARIRCEERASRSCACLVFPPRKPRPRHASGGEASDGPVSWKVQRTMAQEQRSETRSQSSSCLHSIRHIHFRLVNSVPDYFPPMLSTACPCPFLFFSIGLGSLGLIQVPQCSTLPKLSVSPHSPFIRLTHALSGSSHLRLTPSLGAACSAPHVSASCPVFPSSADATGLDGCLWCTSLW